MSCPAPMQSRDRLETTRGLLGGKSCGRGQEGTFWPAVFSRSQTPVINHPHPHPRGMVQDRPQCPLPLHAGAGRRHVPSLSPGWAGHHTGTSQAGQKPLVAGWGAGPEHRLGSLPPSWPRTTSRHQWGSVHRVLAELPSVTGDGESQDAIWGFVPPFIVAAQCWACRTLPRVWSAAGVLFMSGALSISFPGVVYKVQVCTLTRP